jgi:purine-nucleoside phosphorylase
MEERFNAEMFINHICRKRNIQISDFNLAPVVVTSWSKRFVEDFASIINAEKFSIQLFDATPIYTGKINEKKCSVVGARVGASTMVMHLEEIVACGAKIIINVGFAGSLQVSNPVGSIIIPTDCISEEGTSQHYWNGEKTCDKELSEILYSHCKSAGLTVSSGKLWTTDAPYRELISKIHEYIKAGVLGVDMETSAVYSFGKYKDIRICNILVVTDELWTDWNPDFSSPLVSEGLKKLLSIVHDTIKDL